MADPDACGRAGYCDPVPAGVLAGALAEGAGQALADGFLSPEELQAWQPLLAAREAALAPARVGRARTHQPQIRGDRIGWIDLDQGPAPAQALHQRLERLRIALNRQAYLGLNALETHLALYPPGTHYAAHLDRLRGDDDRVLSCVLYLNPAWDSAWGGALRLYRGRSTHAPWRDIEPMGGRLVLFLADAFIHEVLPATQPRWSLTGWFRRKAAL